MALDEDSKRLIVVGFNKLAHNYPSDIHARFVRDPAEASLFKHAYYLYLPALSSPNRPSEGLPSYMNPKTGNIDLTAGVSTPHDSNGALKQELNGLIGFLKRSNSFKELTINARKRLRDEVGLQIFLVAGAFDGFLLTVDPLPYSDVEFKLAMDLLFWEIPNEFDLQQVVDYVMEQNA